MGSSLIIGIEHGTNALDGHVEPARDFPIAGLKPARACRRSVELAREARAIAPQRLQLLAQILFAAIGILAAFDRCLEPIDGERQAPGGCLDGAHICHPLTLTPTKFASHATGYKKDFTCGGARPSTPSGHLPKAACA